MEKLFLGVDGGNTKTDFFLFDREGALRAHLRMGTCSHEALGGYNQARLALQEGLLGVTGRAGCSMEDIVSAQMGLAGVDLPEQREALEGILKSLGLRRFLVSNDSFLGLKAAAPDGVGICSINGTGTVTGGVDEKGNQLQVGGIGDITSDYAGGGYLAREVLRKVYDFYYRDGKETSMTGPVCRILGMREGEDMLPYIHESRLHYRKVEKELCCLLFDSANAGDAVARDVVSALGCNLARSVCGCASHLYFTRPIAVVLAGSVWVKSGCPQLMEEFCGYLERRLELGHQIYILQEPPALGAVLWAYELHDGHFPSPELKSRVLEGARSAMGIG